MIDFFISFWEIWVAITAALVIYLFYCLYRLERLTDKIHYKVGDRVLIRNFGGDMFHGFIKGESRGFFGKKYLVRHGVESDFMGHYEVIKYISARRIVGKD